MEHVFEGGYAEQVAAYLPPGWPAGVHPPGSERFEQTAVNWLLDVVPPDYRVHGVLLRHPVALAALARHHVTACVEGARQGYRTARAELAADLPPGVIEAVLAVYRSEGSRLAAAARSVDLIERGTARRGFPAAARRPPGGRPARYWRIRRSSAGIGDACGAGGGETGAPAGAGIPPGAGSATGTGGAVSAGSAGSPGVAVGAGSGSEAGGAQAALAACASERPGAPGSLSSILNHTVLDPAE